MVKKKGKHRTVQISDVGEGEFLQESPQPIEAHLDDQRRIMAHALQALPSKERAALILRDLEELSTGDVAYILNSSETTVRSQICKARMRMKRFVDDTLRRKP